MILSSSSPRDLNESHTTHSSSLDSFGFPKLQEAFGFGNKSVSTATLRAAPHSTKGIPRSQYSSMTTKLSNRRVRSTQIPGVQEDDHVSNLSEDRLVPYYTKPKPKPTLSSLGIGSRPPRSPADLHSIKSYSSAGSFNFETLSTTAQSPSRHDHDPHQRPPTTSRTMEPQTPQSEFHFMERSAENPYPAVPISMTLADNAMQHSAFKPRKLAYQSSSSSPAARNTANDREWR